MKHRATIHCGSCSRATEVELGGCHIVGCKNCGSQIRLCQDAPIEEQSIEELIEELGGKGVLEVLRSTASSQVLPQMAAALHQMCSHRAEATLAHIIWYLTDYREGGVSLPRVLQLLRLCEVGSIAGATEGWLVGPVARA